MCLIHCLFLYSENRGNVFEGLLESNMFKHLAQVQLSQNAQLN